MKRTLLALSALLAVAAYASAGVLDGFEGGAAWVNNYTMTDTAPGDPDAVPPVPPQPLVIVSAATGNNGESPFAGSELGMCTGSGQDVYANLWNAGEQVSSGDTVSIAVNIQQSSWSGGGLIVKTFDTDFGYHICLGNYLDGAGDNLFLSAGAKDLLETPGTSVRYWAPWGTFLEDANGHTAPIRAVNLGELSGWFVIQGTYTEVDATNVIDIKVYDSLGVEIATETYTDSGTAAVDAQGAGDFGFVVQPWALQVDVDELSLVKAAGPCLMGDANGDGVVGIADLSALADYYGVKPDATWEMGDFNADGEVGIADLVALADHYGETGPPCDPGTVPEPATLAMLAMGGLALIRKRR